MTKCPQCGKDLNVDDILIPVEDPSGKVVDCFHMKKVVWDEFLKSCQSAGRSPFEVWAELMGAFVKQHNKENRVSRRYRGEK
jgi:hypothetical protein